MHVEYRYAECRTRPPCRIEPTNSFATRSADRDDVHFQFAGAASAEQIAMPIELDQRVRSSGDRTSPSVWRGLAGT